MKAALCFVPWIICILTPSLSCLAIMKMQHFRLKPIFLSHCTRQDESTETESCMIFILFFWYSQDIFTFLKKMGDELAANNAAALQMSPHTLRWMVRLKNIWRGAAQRIVNRLRWPWSSIFFLTVSHVHVAVDELHCR